MSAAPASARERRLRHELAAHLVSTRARPTFERATAGLSPALCGVRPPGAPHTAWEIVEHVRLDHADLLALARDPAHRQLAPSESWPPEPAPPDDAAWEASRAAVRRDLEALEALLRDPERDVLAPLPGREAAGTTLLRVVLVLADHTAYHVGELVQLRRRLGAWPPPEPRAS